MQKIIYELGQISPDIIPEGLRAISVKFGKIWIEKPAVREADGVRRALTPMEARLRDLTYEAPIFLEMWVSKDDVDEEKQVVNIGNLPIMVRSKYCTLSGKTKKEMIAMGEDPEDTGGYFIINGTERVVVAMEDLAPNKIFVEKTTGPYPFIAKTFSDDGQYKIPHILEKSRDGIIYVSFTRIKRIPFAIMMKALGITNDKEIMEAVSKDESLHSDLYINLYESAEISTSDEAIDFIGQKMGVSQEVLRKRRALDSIDNFFLPHISHDSKLRRMKAYFLAKAVKKLLVVSHGGLEEDDKDHYKNKRIQLVGDLMESLFRFSFKMLTGDIKYNFERLVKRGKMPSLVRATRSKLLTSRIRSVLSTGEWIGGRHGVSQHLDRLNVFATLSHLRRVVSPLRTSREAFEARDLHPTHWGRLCAAETPEGPSIGLRKNLAILSEISPKHKTQSSKLIKKFEQMGLKVIE